jgi:hypothetical protein
MSTASTHAACVSPLSQRHRKLRTARCIPARSEWPTPRATCSTQRWSSADASSRHARASFSVHRLDGAAVREGSRGCSIARALPGSRASTLPLGLLRSAASAGKKVQCSNEALLNVLALLCPWLLVVQVHGAATTLRVMRTESSAGSRTRVQVHVLGPRTAVAAAGVAAGEEAEGPATGEAAGAARAEAALLPCNQHHQAAHVRSSRHARV